MRRGGLLEVALGFTVLLASYTSHGADANLEAGNVKETRASRAKRRGGGGHDALKGESTCPVGIFVDALCVREQGKEGIPRFIVGLYDPE
ncbi:hypothetical protein CB1_001731005 [Camelus ferus]|nr:hypothetical protein CB1_001731005 [Camelus ferus]